MSEARDDLGNICMEREQLRELYDNMLLYANTRLNTHLLTAEDDPMKRNIKKNLAATVYDTFSLLLPNISVEGQDLQSLLDVLALNPIEEVEKFDLDLDQELRQVLGQVEEETVALASLRRGARLQLNSKFKPLVDSVESYVSNALQEISSRQDDPIDEAEFSKHQKPYSDQRLDDVTSKLKLSVENLSRLKDLLPEDLSAMESHRFHLKMVQGASIEPFKQKPIGPTRGGSSGITNSISSGADVEESRAIASTSPEEAGTAKSLENDE